MRLLRYLTICLTFTAPLVLASEVKLKNGSILKGEIQGLLVLRSRQKELNSGRFTSYMRIYKFTEGPDVLNLDENGIKIRLGALTYALGAFWQGITPPEEGTILEFWSRGYKDGDKDTREAYVNGPGQLPWRFVRSNQETDAAIKAGELLGELKFQGEKVKLFQEIALQEEGKADLTIVPLADIQLWEREP